MIQRLSSPGAGPLPQSGPHDEFLELCAAFTTGDLSDDEQKKLNEHLAVCASCRETVLQYESIVRNVIPAVAAAELPEEISVDSNWSPTNQEAAEKALFERLGREETHAANRTGQSVASLFFPHRILPFSNDSTWRNVWVLYTAGILLFFALICFGYRVGMHRAPEANRSTQPQTGSHPATPSKASLEEQLSDAGHDRAVTNAEISQRDKVIADLRQLLAKQSTEINELKTAHAQLASELQANDVNKRNLSQQTAELSQELTYAEENSQRLEEKLNSLRQQSTKDTEHAKASEAKVNELTRQLQEQDDAVEQRDEMLAKDRDIRDVMGARDLYIAEIYDVAGTGETKKPYGRVFYTRGRSLIFYAYDLDQEAGLKDASTFQAWGRRGPDRQQAINLGVFYEDNTTKKRWILKCDEPKSLAQIDAVFVTIEPQGGSHKPSNKTLLFASLKIDPNHP